MKGAIAAGHPLTAEAGARVLEAGGWAVDACVAAAFVSWVCESPLTGPGGAGSCWSTRGGFRKDRRLWCFVTVPREAAAGEPLEVAVDFDGDPAAAVPYGRRGSCRARHTRSASMPRIAASAVCRGTSSSSPPSWLARDGFELTPAQAYLHTILDPLLRHSPEGDAMYAVEGRSAQGVSGSRSRSSPRHSSGWGRKVRQFSTQVTSRVRSSNTFRPAGRASAG